MRELSSNTKKLEEILKEKGKVKVARAGDYTLTFGSIHYGSFEILCQIESRCGTKSAEWRLEPLGIRVKKRDFFDAKEEYYKPNISQEEFKVLLLGSLDCSNCELISQVSITSIDQAVTHFKEWSDERNKEVFECVLEKIDDMGLKKGKVLDLACGIGELMQMVSSKYPGLNCYGIDLSQKNVQLAREKVGQNRVFYGNAANIGTVLSDVYFDLITATGLITKEVIQTKQIATDVIIEAYKRLEKNGRIIITDFAPILTDKKTLESVGFDVLQTCIPKNFFNYKQPKQLYIGKKIEIFK